MPLFVLIGHDAPGSAARRAANRDAHVAHITEMDRQGRIVLAGPVRNDADEQSTGAVIVFEAASLEAARAWAAQDPYARAGVFETCMVAPFRRAFPAAP